MQTAKAKYLSAATDLGLTICRDAIWSGDRCTWISVLNENLPTGQHLRYHATGADFYGGTAGIAFFLGNLCRFTEEPLFRETASGALRQGVAIKDLIPPPARLGFYSGWTGLAYTLIDLGHQLGEPEWVNKGKALASDIMALDLNESGLDVIDGLAGAIPAFIHMYELQPDPAYRKFIQKLGDRIIETAEKTAEGWSWNTMEMTKKNLTGYAHGTAGFLNALLDLYTFTGESRYLDGAYEALRSENSSFDTGQQNWPDFRDVSDFFPGQEQTDEPTFGCTWCHGAPGIGLARLKGYFITGDERFKKDLAASLDTTYHTTGLDFEMGYSLCHGTFGNAELILEASDYLDKHPSWATYPWKAGDYAIEHYLKKGRHLQNGNGVSFVVPDFMTGLAGMGYFFLRLYDPQACPSVLLLNGKRVVVDMV